MLQGGIFSEYDASGPSTYIQKTPATFSWEVASLGCLVSTLLPDRNVVGQTQQVSTVLVLFE